MADVLFAVTVDLGRALHALCREVQARIDAAKDLPQTATRCSRLLDQIDGMVDGLNQYDKRTRVILENIQSCVKELDNLLTRLLEMADVNGKAGKKSVCLCITLASKGKDVKAAESELENTEYELRNHIESLVQATQLHSFSTRTSNKLEQVDSRRFWDEHFGDMREVSVKAIAEGLNHECESKNLGVDTETVVQLAKDCFAGKETVSVLEFGEVFNRASIPDTMVSLAKRARAKTSLLEIEVYDFEGKTIDTTLHPGFVMCRDSDSLKVLRGLIMTHALTLTEEESSSDGSEFDFDGDEAAPPPANGQTAKPKVTAEDLDSLPPEYRFLAAGDFTFFLDECRMRVQRKQEKKLSGMENLMKVCLVRDDDLPEELRPKKKTSNSRKPRLSASLSEKDTAWEKSSTGTSAHGDDDDGGIDAEVVAQSIMRKAAEEVAARDCKSVAAAIRVPLVLHGLRVAAKKTGVPEESVTFLVEVDQLRQAAEAISPTSAGALSMPRLRLVKASATNIAERFLSANSAFKLPVSPDTAATANRAVQRCASLADDPDPIPGLDHGMLEALRGPFVEVEAALALALEALQQKNATLNMVVDVGKKNKHTGPKKKVVVCGGGVGGAWSAYHLDNDSEERFHVTIVDPKNYFEDPTTQPMLMCDPGLPTEGRFANSVAPFSKIVTKGKHLCGLVTSIATTHVLVGSQETVVPFDYLILATGSSYHSNIKVVNPTAEYRWKQHQAELASMKNASAILVIGGGVVGCEIAGNAADRLHTANGGERKKVILVHAGPQLLPRTGGHKYVFDYLTSLGVEIHLNQRVIEFDDMLQQYTSDTGEVFSAGKVYRCTGAEANTQALRDAQSDPVVRAALDAKGFVKVDDHLRLHDAPHIFAIGDIVEGRMFPSTGAHAVTGKVAAERTADFAAVHGFAATTNVIRSVSGEPLVSIDASRNVHGQMLAVDMGPAQGALISAYELAEGFKAMGFDMGGVPENLKKDKASLSEKVPGFKEFLTSIIVNLMTVPDVHDQFWGMKAGYQEVVDPLRPPVDEAAGAEAAAPIDETAQGGEAEVAKQQEEKQAAEAAQAEAKEDADAEAKAAAEAEEKANADAEAKADADAKAAADAAAEKAEAEKAAAAKAEAEKKATAEADAKAKADTEAAAAAVAMDAAETETEAAVVTPEAPAAEEGAGEPEVAAETEPEDPKVKNTVAVVPLPEAAPAEDAAPVEAAPAEAAVPAGEAPSAPDAE